MVLCICTCVCVCVCVHACMHACVHECVHACMLVCVFVCFCCSFLVVVGVCVCVLCASVCVCACMCLPACMCVVCMYEYNKQNIIEPSWFQTMRISYLFKNGSLKNLCGMLILCTLCHCFYWKCQTKQPFYSAIGIKLLSFFPFFLISKTADQGVPSCFITLWCGCLCTDHSLKTSFFDLCMLHWIDDT